MLPVKLRQRTGILRQVKKVEPQRADSLMIVNFRRRTWVPMRLHRNAVESSTSSSGTDRALKKDN